MKTRQEKLRNAYNLLRSKGEIHTKTEFAKEIGFIYTNLSSAFNGNYRYLTDGLFEKICKRYPDFFKIEDFICDGDILMGENVQKINSITGGHYNVQFGLDSILSGNPNASVGTINYHVMSQDEMLCMMEDRWQHFKRKEKQVEQIFEENRVLTNECRKLNSEKEELIKRNHLLADRLIAAIEKLNELRK